LAVAAQTGQPFFDAELHRLQGEIALARVWCGQVKRADARDLLAPTYAWFSEGFDSHDLVAARGLLEQLG